MGEFVYDFADECALLDSLSNTPQSQPSTIGVLISQGADGIINSIVFATTETVFLPRVWTNIQFGSVQNVIPYISRHYLNGNESVDSA
ncbi:hypothetical protein VKT23_013504 [Stygiomarasmius scandens]|uniref:Uncharacterized protein n=1 Tax=Marasmiellus scandens TaxID=2682957 RepID=A0ABR1J5A6_9AGAR